ncbi:hypothetical protein GWI33_002622 [Rhynchophorus ferrugineus]|uniref:Uncharacterized protein n=1 Tax=Rhynchophorus ferrugineus TaxID=354439 RepID=A0A834IYG6_RHYFE|nr:hypothetical protein GWI33_002622 [Rhynchophorus ferrugineus]
MHVITDEAFLSKGIIDQAAGRERGGSGAPSAKRGNNGDDSYIRGGSTIDRTRGRMGKRPSGGSLGPRQIDGGMIGNDGKKRKLSFAGTKLIFDQWRSDD